jgi:uncharacterized glyoxalase superfamily protein PhnB
MDKSSDGMMTTSHAGTRSSSMPGDAFTASELTASLTVTDLPASLAWYRDVVGFSVAQQYERGGRPMAVSLRAGQVKLLIVQDDGAKGVGRARGEGFSLQLTTSQNIDEVARGIRERGGQLDSEPEDMRRGQRAFRLRDPDGFRLTISSERPPET